MTQRRVRDPAAAANSTATEAALRELARTYATDATSRPFGSDDALAGGSLDARTGAIVRIAALIALGASASSYQSSVDAARSAGVTGDEVLGVLLTVAPRVGLARLVAATIPLALAIGYNIDAAFESLDPRP